MALAAHQYTKFSFSALSKLMSLNNVDTIKCMLVVGSDQSGPTTANMAALVDSAQFVASAGGGLKSVASFLEVSASAGGSNYTTGGVALTGVSVTNSGHVTTLTGTIPSFGSTVTSSFNPGYAVFIDTSPGTDATNPLICYWDLLGSGLCDVGQGGTYTLTVASGGLCTLTNSTP